MAAAWAWACVATALLVASARADESEYAEDFTKVTCGSAVKLQHTQSGFRLHSHAINWGSGSGQQSVTAVESGDDANSLWAVREASGAPLCHFGTPVQCGAMVRLVHAKTNKYLHSHLHRAPLTGRQEVSGYGDAKSGHSDTGDNWRVECEQGADWTRATKVRLIHVDTGRALYARGGDKFNDQNCRNCPIIGQLEVSADRADDNTWWKTNEGVYFPVSLPQ